MNDSFLFDAFILHLIPSENTNLMETVCDVLVLFCFKNAARATNDIFLKMKKIKNVGMANAVT